MRRCFYLLPLLIFSIAAFGFNSSDLKNENQLLNVSPTTTPTPVQAEESEEIVLDKKVVCHPCPQGYRCRPNSDCPDGSTNMTVTVSAVKPDNEGLTYEYNVSGGRIIGEGAKVIWDLSGGAQPGTYNVEIVITDKLKGYKLTETKTITVMSYEEFDCVYCPTLTVQGPTSPMKIGETIVFTANVSGGSVNGITYNWKVSAGEIIEGQGTPVIKVATNAKMAGKTVKATVEIEGVCDECKKSESAEVSIAKTETVKKKN